MPKPPSHTKNHFRKLLASHSMHLTMMLLFLILVVPFIVALSLNLKPSKDIKYGVTFNPYYAHELGLDWKETYLEILDDLKVDHVRLGGYWNRIEESPGYYNFSDVTWQLDEAKQRNVNVIFAIGRKVPRWPECYEPPWVRDLSTSEADKALLEFIALQVNTLKKYDNIKMWQVENEPFFPFGDCRLSSLDFLKKEVELVRSLDDKNRPVIVQDSGEGGFWFPTYSAADYLGISMYRRVQYGFWKSFLGKEMFFTYPLSYWSYPLKARITQVPQNRIVVLELQAEPWAGSPLAKLSDAQKDETMSHDKFLDTLSYAQKSGFDTFYLWGVEWWYFEKTKNNNPFFWEASKALWK